MLPVVGVGADGSPIFDEAAMQLALLALAQAGLLPNAHAAPPPEAERGRSADDAAAAEYAEMLRSQGAARRCRSRAPRPRAHAP
jgi:hypothetical protein